MVSHLGHYAYVCYCKWFRMPIVEANDFMARADKDKILVWDVEDGYLASCGAANLAKASQRHLIDNVAVSRLESGLYVSHHM